MATTLIKTETATSASGRLSVAQPPEHPPHRRRTRDDDDGEGDGRHRQALDGGERLIASLVVKVDLRDGEPLHVRRDPDHR
jgi:hypothetical protein